MPNVKLLKDLVLLDEHWGFWNGFLLERLGLDDSKHWSVLKPWPTEAKPCKQSKQGLYRVTDTQNLIFPSERCLNSCRRLGRGTVCLWQQDVEGRWKTRKRIQRHQSVLLQLWALVTQICRDTKQEEEKNQKMVQRDTCSLLPNHP